MRRNKENGRRGFSLVELIVVVGLMGLLATISIGGYFAASRGMADRGVVQDTASLIRMAAQTCLIDQTPTAVLFFNRNIGQSEEEMSTDERKLNGRAVAIKMVGRISYVIQNGGMTSAGETISAGGGALLIDEFADWNQSYPVDPSDNARSLSVRLYRMFGTDDGTGSLESGLNGCSSLMCAWVGFKNFDEDYMISSGMKVVDWCRINGRTHQGNSEFSGVGYRNANSYRWGLPFHPKNDGLAPSRWRVGDAYGVEIGAFNLPPNYIFGGDVPTENSDVEWVTAKSPSKGVLLFLPGDVTNVNDYEFSSVNSVKISAVNGSDIRTAGIVDRGMLKDQD